MRPMDVSFSPVVTEAWYTTSFTRHFPFSGQSSFFLKLHDDRVESMAMKVAFITLKENKENFESRPTCRLINPSKPEIDHINRPFWKNKSETRRHHESQTVEGHILCFNGSSNWLIKATWHLCALTF